MVPACLCTLSPLGRKQREMSLRGVDIDKCCLSFSSVAMIRYSDKGNFIEKRSQVKGLSSIHAHGT